MRGLHNAVQWALTLAAVSAAALPRGTSEEPFDYFTNSWSVIGLKDYDRGTRITPDNKLMIGALPGTTEGEADKASVQVRFGRNLELLSTKQTKRLLEGWLPIVLVTAQENGLRYEFSFWATPLPSVSDWRRAFEGPGEGENFLNWILVRVANTGDKPAEASVRVEACGPYEASSHPVPMLAAPRDFSWSVEPDHSVEGALAIPWEPVTGTDSSVEVSKLWLQRTVDYWHALLADATSIRVPCEKAAQAYLAAHVCQLIASDHGALHGGEGFYDEFYIRDGAYQVMELEEAGLAEAARNAISIYLASQREDGRFESQKDQFDANGQALWALWQYFKITGDRPWLERAYPQMHRAVDWIAEARKTTEADAFKGLLPNAPADGEFLWDGKHHIVGYDFWNLRGILCTADAARILGKTQDMEKMQAASEDYHDAIDAVWQRTGLPHFPPSWEAEGTHWGNTETLWPTPLFPLDDARMTALMDEVRSRHLGGFIEGTIQWQGGKVTEAIHPYMSAYTTMASLVRGEHEKVVEEFYWYLLHSTATHGFPEGIFYKRRFAWSNTIPHVTGASNYALLLRHMLLHEQGDDLHLLSAVPDGWLGEGQEIRVERGPTHFGAMGLTVRGTPEGVQVDLEPPLRQAPKRIVLHLPESRPLLNALEGVELAPREGQTGRVDFPSTITRYHGQHSEHPDTNSRE
ncbi:MAG: hypothetical protein HYS27_19025 [Deltaproteobacteria bacterium]|nr:hypothetical protein [Deltaproteobacteria bacterium]